MGEEEVNSEKVRVSSLNLNNLIYLLAAITPAMNRFQLFILNTSSGWDDTQVRLRFILLHGHWWMSATNIALL